MVDPAVVVAMREFKAGLLRREAGRMQEMARRWLEVEGALEAQIAELAREFAAEKEAGRAISRARLYRMERYKRLLNQLQREFEEYAIWAEGIITDGQREFGELGLDHSIRAVQLSYYPSVGVHLDRLPVEAVENMAGIAGNGRPLGELLRLRMVRDASGAPVPGVLERLTRTLIDGTAQGWNPRKTAQAMRDDLAGGLQKALTIARTEQLRVYRQVGLDQYRASGVVLGQKRLTAHDDRVCPACIADEGTLYPLDATISDHPQGRCTSVPVVKDVPEIDWLSGEDWFRTQSEATQRSILGPGRLEAWQAGTFEFGQLVTHQHDATWGGSIVPTPLAQLVN